MKNINENLSTNKARVAMLNGGETETYIEVIVEPHGEAVTFNVTMDGDCTGKWKENGWRTYEYQPNQAPKVVGK